MPKRYSLIIPAAGKSSRFPHMRPKWMLTHPNGNLMVAEAIQGLNLSDFDKIYFVYLKEHEEKYSVRDGLLQQFGELGLSDKLTLVELPEATRHQPETVAKAIEYAEIKGPFCVKDTDNYFVANAKPGNFVSTADLASLNEVNPGNKSYVKLDDKGSITQIVEKNIVSRFFCTGLYGFASGEEYMRYYRELAHNDDLYISHIIFKMLLAGHEFDALPVEHYVDWGTVKEWRKFCNQYLCVITDLDGCLVENSAQYFPPKWGETCAIAENVALLNKLYDSGRAQIIITTSRKESFRAQTIAQLEREGIKYHSIVFGLQHGKRVLINDYSNTNPYPSSVAINLKRNASDLPALLESVVGVGGPHA